jgi:type II secretory pathway pseudopilin PulG
MRPEFGTPTQEIRLKQQSNTWQYLRLVAAIAVIFLTASASALQSKQTTALGVRKTAPRKTRATDDNKMTGVKVGDSDLAWLQDLLKNKELMAELEKLGQKLKDGVQNPAPRSQSKILSRLSDSTLFYIALPNYGDTLHQAQQIFQQELRESAPLREFLQKNKLDATESKIEKGVEQFYEFSQFLGDELVITGKMEGQEPAFVLVAEVRKPGIKEFLEKMNAEVFTDKKDSARIVDAQELASIEPDKKNAPVMLVRPDLLVLGFNIASLREFNAQLDQSGPRFMTGPLGQRVAQSYQGGASTVFGVDLHKVVGLVPQSKPQNREMLEKTGFADVNYLVTENKITGGRSANKMELTFNGPRRGAASWIAAAAPMGGLDFVSSKAAIAGDLMLKDPAQIFDDLQEIMGKESFAMVPQMEAQFNVNLKQDLLSKLGGEIAFEMQAPPMMAAGDSATKSATPLGGAFKVILRVLDPAGLQQTLSRLLVMAPMQSGKREEEGVTFNTLTSPGPAGEAKEINYFFMDGYLVIASDRDTANEAVHQHRKGDSLGKSSKLREALAGQPANASIMMYQNAGQMLGPMFAQLPPEIRQLLPNTSQLDTKANVFYVNADKNSFRGSTSDNINTDISMGLIVAAIAIPNLLRSRIAANESAAIGTVRTVNTAEIVYTTTYPKRGYASSLAAMGPPINGGCSRTDITPAHACLLDEAVGNASCTAGKWCTKNGYRYSVRGVCGPTGCNSYVVTTTPVNTGTGTKSFCSTVDAVIRVSTGTPLEEPLTAAQCKAWRPIR